jgi:UDP-N-acetyl-D-mannosaminuronic acid dehydrogenase
MKKVCVLGLGFIGLPTACILASSGYETIGVDIDEKRVDIISSGKLPFQEMGLEELIKDVINSGKLVARTKVEEADIFVVCVQTPLDKNNKCDLTYIFKAINMIAKVLKKGNLVILESTVPVGVTKMVAKMLEKKTGLKAGKDFYMAHCPERAIPGNLLHELQYNDKLIGGINEVSARYAKKIYKKFVRGKIYITDSNTAEMVKLIENTFRDVNIALANEVAIICDELGLNVWEIIELANKHPRVNLHKPGPGVGGHCLPLDPWFISQNTTRSKFMLLARNINDSMPGYVVNRIKEIIGKERKVSIFGVTYKGNVDDVRNSPAKEIVRLLKNDGYEVGIFDPIASRFEYKLDDLESSVKDSSCIIITVDHSKFKRLNPKKIGKLMKRKIIFDTKNCINFKKWERAGFKTLLLGAIK